MYSRCHNYVAGLRGVGLMAVACILIGAAACQRERRDLRPSPAVVGGMRVALRESELQPGGPRPVSTAKNPYEGNAYAISEGQRLFSWYNCTGCHANGGGSIGPPLIKTEWIYGGDPANLFDSIMTGRPNGMPTWSGRIPEYQIWQLVAYVRSLNGLEPKSSTPSRPDTIEQDPNTILPRPRTEPK